MKKLVCLIISLILIGSVGFSQNLTKGKNEVNIPTGDGLDGYEGILANKSLKKRNISGQLYLPGACKNKKFPAVIIQHGLGGSNTQWYPKLAQYLNKNGIAALVPDSLSSRGLGFRRSMLLSKANRLYDTFASFRYLQKVKCIDSKRVGITGYSLGGTIAIDVVESKLAKKLGNGNVFKASLPVYPSCHANFIKTRPTNTVVHILAAGADDWTPASQCIETVKKKRAKNWNIRITVLKGAHHGFNNDFPPTKKTDRWHFKECGYNVIDEKGVETNKKYGMSTSMGWKNMMMAGVKKCGRRGVTIGGTPQLVNKTLKFTANFFNENLKRVSALKAGFKKLSLDQRKQIQTVLSNAGYYKSTIDGLYGKNTEKGLKSYNQKILGGLNLEKSDAVNQLIQKILD